MGEPAQHHLSFPPSPAVPLRRTVAPFALSGNALLIPVKRGKGQRNPGLSRFGRLAIPSLFLLLWLSGCSFGQEAPTRTPFPTWTPTPIGQPSQGEAATVQANTVQANTVQANTVPTDTPLPPPPAAPTDTPTTVPPTPAPTDTPAATPTLAPTDTPADTPTPEPTATTAFAFTLEAAEKFPTDSLAANVVRIYLYVYSPVTYGLPGYTLQVIHNGSPLTVDEVSTEGIPEQTRPEPGPYTRFANMSVVFVEPQAGRWDIQLLDPQRVPVGPPVAFDLTADERTRELYVRYQQQ